MTERKNAFLLENKEDYIEVKQEFYKLFKGAVTFNCKPNFFMISFILTFTL